MRTILLVFKDIAQTRFMQDVDVFEKFKFIGRIEEVIQEDSHAHLAPAELLEKMGKCVDNQYAVVGVMIPYVGSAFLPNHTVFSNGHQWITIEGICERYNASAPSKE